MSAQWNFLALLSDRATPVKSNTGLLKACAARLSSPRRNRCLDGWSISVVAAPILAAVVSCPAVAQQTLPAPLVLTPPKVNTADENSVSLLSGKLQMTIPALKLGEVSFTPFSYNGPHFAAGGISDENYGRVIVCSTLQTAPYWGSAECAASTPDPSIQTILGQERATFSQNQSTGVYTPAALDGSSYTDTYATDGFCTWTKKDGTKVVYYGIRTQGDSLCNSTNVAKIIYPDCRTQTY